jgi:hypothetical protein
MARQREPHGEPEKRPLSPADHIPTPGAVGSALLQVIPRLPSAPFEIIGALSDALPLPIADREAGG